MSPELRVDWCSAKAASFAVKHWHYSKVMPTPPAYSLGVWEDGSYIGAVVFSRGPKGIASFFGVEGDCVCELARVALSKHATPVTRIIRVAVAMLKKAWPTLSIIVSYADPMQGHDGAIYRAGNWTYLGTTPASTVFLSPDGKMRHSRTVSERGFKRYYGQAQRVWKRSECRAFKAPGKHRYAIGLTPSARAELNALAQNFRSGATLDPCVRSADSGTAAPTAGGGANPTRTLQPTSARAGARCGSATLSDETSARERE